MNAGEGSRHTMNYAGEESVCMFKGSLKRRQRILLVLNTDHQTQPLCD